jgi:hypothetical protein
MIVAADLQVCSGRRADAPRREQFVGKVHGHRMKGRRIQKYARLAWIVTRAVGEVAYILVRDMAYAALVLTLWPIYLLRLFSAPRHHRHDKDE